MTPRPPRSTLSLHDALPIYAPADEVYKTLMTEGGLDLCTRPLLPIPHHFAHACGAYYSSPFRGEAAVLIVRSEEHTSELQSQSNLVCRLLLEKKKNKNNTTK